MLTTAITDFAFFATRKLINQSEILADLQSDLDECLKNPTTYNPEIIKLLRKTGQKYISGQLSIESLDAIVTRTVFHYRFHEGTESELIIDLRSALRKKSNTDLYSAAAALLQSRGFGIQKNKRMLQSLHALLKSQDLHPSKHLPVRCSGRTATTSTGVILRLVK